MGSRRLHDIGALIVLMTAPALAGAAIVGEARGVADGELRYSEHHACSNDGSQCTVEYRDRSGEVFARKSVDYASGLQSPSLVLEDFRSGETLQVTGSAGEDVVVDAGFDHYVRQRWDDLAAGREVQFDFLVAGRDEPLPMAARLDEKRACASDMLCLEVAVDMWFAALLVDPIQLVYDDQRRLTQFRGVSNIPADNGRPQTVEINYRYPAGPAGPQDQ